MKRVGVLVGSLRKESYSGKIASNIITLFPKGYEIELIEIGHLPFYNQDFDDHSQVPKSYDDFRDKIKEMDAFLFVTPEYNRSVPAVLKNALDVASRPKVENWWSGKPALVVSQSPGNLGGFGANHHLRQTLTAINMPTLQHPEAYISNSASLLDEDGTINNEGTMKFFQKIVDAFVRFAEKNQK